MLELTAVGVLLTLGFNVLPNPFRRKTKFVHTSYGVLGRSFFFLVLYFYVLLHLLSLNQKSPPYLLIAHGNPSKDETAIFEDERVSTPAERERQCRSNIMTN